MNQRVQDLVPANHFSLQRRDDRGYNVFRQAAKAARPQQFGLLVDAAVVALMFPVAKYILTSFALPWLHELRRYSELQRQKVHEWIDEKYREEGFDLNAAEAASDALCDQLEQTTDAAARAAWERLAGVLKETSEDA